jgi:hypothetical protein
MVVNLLIIVGFVSVFSPGQDPGQVTIIYYDIDTSSGLYRSPGQDPFAGTGYKSASFYAFVRF